MADALSELVREIEQLRRRVAALETGHAPPKGNYAATTAPGVGDDVNDGYMVGLPWYDVTADRGYICLDATAGAAVWKSASFVTNTPVQVDSHIAASAAVHGLGASVNVLGNRNAAAEFVQRGTIASINRTTSAPALYTTKADVTFAVAFGSTPIVVGGGTTTAGHNIASIMSITTTGFTYYSFGTNDTVSNIGWIALGA